MARSNSDPRLTFRCLYHDELSGLTREFQLRFYFQDRTVELTDITTKKLFLKRTEARNLEISDFVVGKKVVVFGRLLHLNEYMDVVTRQLCDGTAASQSTFAPASSATTAAVAAEEAPCECCYVFVEASCNFASLGKIYSVLDVELGFTITGITAGTLPAKALDAAEEDCAAAMTMPSAHNVAALRPLAGRMLCCFRVAKPHSEELVSEIYRRVAPGSERGVGGGGACPDAARFGLFAAAAPAAAEGQPHPLDAIFDAVAARAASKHAPSGSAAGAGTILIVKPHVLTRKSAGDVLQLLIDQSGAQVCGMALINLSARDATGMMSAYRGILPDFQATTSQLASGACLAVHLCGSGDAGALAAEDLYRDGRGASRQAHQGGRGDDDDDVFAAVRAICGPFDPTIAKALRSTSIRARYGVNRSCNAVHCADIQEDVASLSRFVFADVAVKRVMKPSAECS